MLDQNQKLEDSKTIGSEVQKSTQEIDNPADNTVTGTDEKKDFWGKLGNFVKKAVDCCLE